MLLSLEDDLACMQEDRLVTGLEGLHREVRYLLLYLRQVLVACIFIFKHVLHLGIDQR